VRSTSFVAREISGDFYFQQRARALQISMVRASGVSQVLIFMTSLCQEWANASQKAGKFTTGAQYKLIFQLATIYNSTRVFTLFARSYLWPNFEKALMVHTERIDCDLGKA
jgi:hypothetical protein